MRFDEACKIFSTREKPRYEEAARAIIISAKSGLATDEIATLALSIAESGETYRLPPDLGPFADVASTGAPASMTTLFCPLLISARGIRVPKLSASGSIAGGIDTFSIIPGFRTQLNPPEFNECLRSAFFAHVRPGNDVCEADHYLIAARRTAMMMANPCLAAASLLGKKLVVPGTVACFDFRVGPTGNVGVDLESASKAADIFIVAAQALGIKATVVLTDNISFPCSALGRLEALALLFELIGGGRESLEIDRKHLSVCITLSAIACELATGRGDPEEEQVQRGLLEKGAVRDRLVRHLKAQGSSWTEFVRVLREREAQNRVKLKASATGFWYPPPLDVAKAWIKERQTNIENQAGKRTFDNQIGLKLLIDPGTEVSIDQPVIELRYPRGLKLEPLPEALSGNVRNSPLEKSPAILATFA